MSVRLHVAYKRIDQCQCGFYLEDDVSRSTLATIYEDLFIHQRDILICKYVVSFCSGYTSFLI